MRVLIARNNNGDGDAEVGVCPIVAYSNATKLRTLLDWIVGIELFVKLSYWNVARNVMS